MPHTKSPLRYPGGKTQLYKFVSHLLSINEIENGVYIEPFSGGAGLALRLLLDHTVERIVINDFDPSIHAFWHSILNNTEAFINLVQNTPVTLDEWHHQRDVYTNNHEDPQSLENGFATFFLNRTNRSGIITGGPIGGNSQDGRYLIDCRYNAENLVKKIQTIAHLADRIDLYFNDATDLINNVILNENPKNTFCFFDPPYYEQGQKLYTNYFTHEDHQQLHDAIINLRDYFWITTYDHAEEVANIYADTECYEYHLQYSAQRKRIEQEYLFSNLNTSLESYERVNLSRL
ncbi:DNA methyltransferase [Eubacterium callanderi]|uniref:site-specific DNA-methyltransferase (adenine-specific) n=1 Tax=Eubacterium callanderi TaxID=53442 RepID=E3GF75_9FIRM|nr:DNA adenine methylase [Eubacterium callanderi]ADO38209.1 DNA methyltransferase [Eubacterium callanderi]OEZ06614.1 D12 class N6 adenine-specific DNA methyltransferase [[Butyribacterium] methylotrophicum]WPK84153.1 hypothetical protein EUCAMar_16860 [Eubacterium callanderi]